jgi:hypothetical protein
MQERFNAYWLISYLSIEDEFESNKGVLENKILIDL